MEVDEIIYLLKRYTKNETEETSELDEQDDAAATSSAGGTTYPTVTKWETGLTRSVANQVDPNSKWKDLYKVTRGKGNTLL